MQENRRRELLLPGCNIINRRSNVFYIISHSTTSVGGRDRPSCKKSPHFCGSTTMPKKQLAFTPLFSKKIIDTAHYGKSAAEASGRPKGTVMSMTFELEGELFMALNGGPVFKFSPAISFFVNWLPPQEEVDELWKRLSEGGEKDQ